LHLHPAVQQRLADFFLACARSGRQLVVETHSEPLVTRLRRRVAEGDADETLKLVSLLFTELRGGDTHLEAVELNSYGGLNSWPEGFFDGQIDDVENIIAAGAEKLAAEGRV
jgi:predicted ATPase